MRRPRTPAAAALLLPAAALLLAGCGGPDLAPVPTEATAPFVCDGVPRAGAELVAGGPVEVEVTGSAWDDDTRPFLCTMSSGERLVRVEVMPVALSPFGPTDEKVLASMAASSSQDPLRLDAPGSGYVWGDASAGWVCDGRSVVVEALGDHVEGRDRAADVTRFLESMLPWACEGQDVPAATSDE